MGSAEKGRGIVYWRKFQPLDGSDATPRRDDLITGVGLRGCIARIKAPSTLDRVEMPVLASLGRRESGYAVYSDGCRYHGCCALHCPSRAIKVIFPYLIR